MSIWIQYIRSTIFALTKISSFRNAGNH